MVLRKWDDLPDFMRVDEVRPYWEILNKKRGQLAAKRVFDFLVSLILFVILAIPMAVISLMIKIEDPGPVLYRQERVTRYGRKFRIHKFRTMVVNADKIGTAVTVGEDPRITKVGKRLRRVRLDELPQVIDVIVGDMSFVGPRPERPQIAREYEKDLPEFQLRLQAKCGLTGYAQVYGKYNTTPYDKLQMDLMYIASPSLAQDFMILIATIKILFMRDCSFSHTSRTFKNQGFSYYAHPQFC